MPPIAQKIATAVAALKRRIRGTRDPNAARILRRRALSRTIWTGLPYIKTLLFTIGYLWLLAIPSSQFGQRTYIDENALQPGQVNTYWNWNDVHRADTVLKELEQLRDRDATSDEIAKYAMREFENIGIPARTQHYSFDTTGGAINGTNAYAVLQSPRASGTEAIVISASWLSRTGEGDGTLNLRGVATVIALAPYLKKYSLWAKDLIFVISDGYLEGMQAWITTYHGAAQPNLHAEPLSLSSGVIWTAINIDYPGHSFSHLGFFFEGLNGRLPNQDLLNSVSLITRHTGNVPVLVYDHIDSREDQDQPSLVPSWFPDSLKRNAEVREYAERARNVLRHMNYQARGTASGVHGLMHQFRIDAITVFAVPATGPHGFHALGRILESSLRTMNNLLERLHASFFFFLLVSPGTFMKIGSYLPSAILVGTAMLFSGLGEWVDAGWVLSTEPLEEEHEHEKTGKTQQRPVPAAKWVTRPRPVLQAVLIMVGTHIFGIVTFYLLKLQLIPTAVWPAYMLIPALPALYLPPPPLPPSSAPVSSVLKAFNLCLASAVVSITSLLNFSLAATLAVLLGLPLTLAPAPRGVGRGLALYAGYAVLALGWLVFAEGETQRALWNWEVLGVWFAPFVCVVYAPLVLQAGLVSLIGT